ncbi:uncharacterized protein LOC127075862 [Lathyrus oleraceus]|uniref:DUF4378 domain-containing protein n=1 Tax=Pisum sativum TaxID=3888 RepID=A0A9D5AWR5_PEA|nr:uncharacterized protein LOC127075862 [Pisum sativum]KAI5421539.1 hypothetical protein KIW84_045094 [Pisum sativum]
MEVVQQRIFNSMERRPRMLKDFLSENPNSCSSSGFKSFPRTTTQNDVVKLTPINNNTIQIHHTLSSSSSKFQTLIQTIKNNVSFFKITKSPSTMLSIPRSLSRKLSSKRRRSRQRCKGEREIEIEFSTVKIKDIIRWKSFRDLQPSVPSPPFDFNRYVTESPTVTTGTTCSSSCDGSSWSDGDFFNALWEAQNDGVEESHRNSFSSAFVSKDSLAPFVGAKENLICQDEQHSPVSVLHVAEHEYSLFDQSLANIERRKQKCRQTADKFESLVKFDLAIANLDKCLSLDEKSYYDEEYKDDKEEEEKKNEEQDWVEEKANQLLHCVKATSSSLQNCDDNLGIVLLEFFKEELNGNRNQKRGDEGFELEILTMAEDWINESFENNYDIVHVNKGAYIKEMDRRNRWCRFEEEQEELVLEIGEAILHSLVDDIFETDG